jgi:choline dehydrogenase-like flavoprotein
VCDVLVVGSGAGGVSAAFPLVEAGLAVRLLDFGNRDDVYAPLIPERTFSELRRTDPQQHRYFLGDHLEGVAFGAVSPGAQLTPPRQHVVRDTESATPVLTESFPPLESLAAGGLAAAWGAGCPPFTDPDLTGFPVSHAELAPCYEAIAARIGVSGARDDLLPFFGELAALLPAVEIDGNARCVLEQYERRRALMHRRGFHLGRPRLAMLSRDLGGRSATAYRDMDFWSDAGRSVYRPQWTLDEMRPRANFAYRPGLLVESFAELPDGTVEVRARGRDGGPLERHRARAVVLAAGTLGTARIVLRSLDRYDVRIPVLCNPHTYAPMVNLRMLGKRPEERRHSLAQLCFLYARDGAAEKATVGHLFTYRSLLGFKLVRESPLAYAEGMEIIRLVTPSFAIAVIQHADEPTDAKYCVLRHGRDGGPDVLEIRYALSPAEQASCDQAERAILSCFRSLGCVCIRRAHPGNAASAHQAGTFPMSTEERELTTTPDGLLRGTRRVYVADGSTFPRLPSKGLTFTLMANAHRIGVGLRDRLRS